MNTISAKKRAGGAALRACRIALLGVLLIGSHAVASEFTVEDLSLTVGVVVGGVGNEGAFFDGAINPFSETHEAELDNFLAGATYDFAWDGSSGSFGVQTWLAADTIDDELCFSFAEGRVWIRPSVDLAVHVEASLDYNLPTHLLEAELDVSAGKIGHSLFSEDREHDTLSHGTGSGTLSISGDFVMPAGELWTLRYSSTVFTDPWSPGAVGQIATASGSVCFTVQALPEPGTLSLAILGGMMLLRHRPQQQQRATNTLPKEKGIR